EKTECSMTDSVMSKAATMEIPINSNGGTRALAEDDSLEQCDAEAACVGHARKDEDWQNGEERWVSDGVDGARVRTGMVTVSLMEGMTARNSLAKQSDGVTWVYTEQHFIG
ncbi:hypothetical protein CHARACLAT_026951, partial [Characodon lateralis]|nr:hypothetical protein [Characodon lateralis]